eukprot:416165_1
MGTPSSIYTRDCFQYPPKRISKKKHVKDKRFEEHKYFIEQSTHLSSQYLQFVTNNTHQNGDTFINGSKCVMINATAYTNVFTETELQNIETLLETIQTQSEQNQNKYKHTSQHEYRGTKKKVLVRTKHFFGVRYLWGDQLKQEGKDKKIGQGLRVDVDEIPQPLTESIVKKLVKYEIIADNWVQGIAFNMYKDGTEGLGPHFDDKIRFERPIVTLRLFSDARIAFDTDLYGCSNGAFSIPLPRGCVLKLEKNGFASDGIKHTIRPDDMFEKSAAVILRRFRESALKEAQLLHKKRLSNGYYEREEKTLTE